jgi:hypothetical protein
LAWLSGHFFGESLAWSAHKSENDKCKMTDDEGAGVGEAAGSGTGAKPGESRTNPKMTNDKMTDDEGAKRW